MMKTLHCAGPVFLFPGDKIYVGVASLNYVSCFTTLPVLSMYALCDQYINIGVLVIGNGEMVCGSYLESNAGLTL